MSGRSHVAETIEALLFATDRPLPAARIASVVPRLETAEVSAYIESLNNTYEESGRTFRIREVAEGYRIYTLPEFASYVEALAVTTRESRLSQAALETLAVVAYRQPVSRSDIEYVRGCDCDGVVRTLLARKMIAIKGRSEAPGRPLLYVTTDRFLEYFGLAQLSDLPDWSEIAALVGEPAARAKLKLVRPAEVASETTVDSVVETMGAELELALDSGAETESELAAAESDVETDEEPASGELVPVAVPRGDAT